MNTQAYYLTAPGMYVGASAVIIATSNTGARVQFARRLLESGVPKHGLAPMTCVEINDLNADEDNFIAFDNGDY